MVKYTVVGVSQTTRETKRGVVTTFSVKCAGEDEEAGAITIKKPSDPKLKVGDVLEITITEKQTTLEEATEGEE